MKPIGMVNLMKIASRAKTARKFFGRSIPVVYKRAKELLEMNKYTLEVLDYGCGFGESRKILANLCHWTGTDIHQRLDFGEGFNSLNFLKFKEYNGFFDMILLSNVLNVQENFVQLMDETIGPVVKLCKHGATVLFNFPKSPRRLEHFDDEQLKGLILDYCHCLDRQDIHWVFCR